MAINFGTKPATKPALTKPSPTPLATEAKAHRAAMVDALAVQAGVRVGRPPSGKIRVTLLLDPAVVKRFKATGPGWQARMNDALAATK